MVPIVLIPPTPSRDSVTCHVSWRYPIVIDISRTKGWVYQHHQHISIGSRRTDHR